MNVRQHLESFLGPTFLELFAHPRARSVPVAAAAAGEPPPPAKAPDLLRSGGHAVYLTWLLGDKSKPNPDCSCFGPKKCDPSLAARKALAKTFQVGRWGGTSRSHPLTLGEPGLPLSILAVVPPGVRARKLI